MRVSLEHRNVLLVFHQDVGTFVMVVLLSMEGGTDGRAEL